jgi:pantoate--beta-alanine ligase
VGELNAYLSGKKSQNQTIGFVPTMGALHKGHLALVAAAKARTDVVVCSIYVNPTQFNNAEDLEKYPRTIETDLALLAQQGCDVVFLPQTAEMYPEGEEAGTYEFGKVTHLLEGAFRPGHFDGVITIVKKLFDSVKPHEVFFGQKDFQQCMVVRDLIRYFKMPVVFNMVPTVREADGLALSSRNVRLQPEDREAALTLYKVLSHIKKHKTVSLYTDLKKEAEAMIAAWPVLKLEYLEVVDAESLTPVSETQAGREEVALIACWCGQVRLIDNMLLND